MSLVSEIITQDQIQDLWGCGFTIVSRHRHPDPFFVSQDMVPQGRSYQWWHLVHDKFHFHHNGDSGWAPVPASRHDGYFMPFGHVGDIEVNGLGLFEKSKVEVDLERSQNVVAAHDLVADWARKTGGEFSGGFKVDGIETEIVGYASAEKAAVRIPMDMVPYIALIFAERDRLIVEQLFAWNNSDAEPTALQREITGKYNKNLGPNLEQGLEHGDWPILRATVLPYAIENVRKSLKRESES